MGLDANLYGYVHNDPLRLIDPSGLSALRFGNSTGSSLTRYTYTGREFDPDTGLLYYYARVGARHSWGN